MAEIRIIDGPDRIELAHSLMYAHASVAFDIGGVSKLLTVHVFIDGLVKIGRSTTNWNFTGSVNREPVNGTYNSISHVGILKIPDKMLRSLIGDD